MWIWRKWNHLRYSVRKSLSYSIGYFGKHFFCYSNLFLTYNNSENNPVISLCFVTTEHIYCINCVIVVVSKLDLCCLFPLRPNLSLLRISSRVGQFSADMKLNKMMTQPKGFHRSFLQTAAVNGKNIHSQIQFWIWECFFFFFYFILFTFLYLCLDLTTSCTE